MTLKHPASHVNYDKHVFIHSGGRFSVPITVTLINTTASIISQTIISEEVHTDWDRNTCPSGVEPRTQNEEI